MVPAWGAVCVVHCGRETDHRMPRTRGRDTLIGPPHTSVGGGSRRRRSRNTGRGYGAVHDHAMDIWGPRHRLPPQAIQLASRTTSSAQAALPSPSSSGSGVGDGSRKQSHLSRDSTGSAGAWRPASGIAARDGGFEAYASPQHARAGDDTIRSVSPTALCVGDEAGNDAAPAGSSTSSGALTLPAVTSPHATLRSTRRGKSKKKRYRYVCGVLLFKLPPRLADVLWRNGCQVRRRESPVVAFATARGSERGWHPTRAPPFCSQR